jgi:uncharacterized Tic20 family protein
MNYIKFSVACVLLCFTDAQNTIACTFKETGTLNKTLEILGIAMLVIELAGIIALITWLLSRLSSLCCDRRICEGASYCMLIVIIVIICVVLVVSFVVGCVLYARI